jgi:hypothetical protein
MSQETTYAGIRGEWQALIAPLAEKPPGLEHLEPFRAKLETALNRAVDITKQQAALAANKQELSKELLALMADGQRVAVVLRKGLKQQFGPKAEQLTAFNVQPFRGRKAKDTVAQPAEGADGSAPAVNSPAR